MFCMCAYNGMDTKEPFVDEFCLLSITHLLLNFMLFLSTCLMPWNLGYIVPLHY